MYDTHLTDPSALSIVWMSKSIREASRMAVPNRSWLRPLAWLLVTVLTLVAWRVGIQLVAAVRRADVCLTVAGLRFEAAGVAPGAFVARVDACVAHPTATQAFLDAFTEIPPLLVVLVAGVLVLMVLTDARTGDPFTARTVGRLRALALVVLVGGLAAAVAVAMAADPLAQSLAPGAVGDEPFPRMDVGVRLLGLRCRGRSCQARGRDARRAGHGYLMPM
jgi:hypothetical protein